MSTIALIDPHSGGHHEWYLQIIAEELSSCGWHVVVVSPRAEIVARSVARPMVVGFAWSPNPADLHVDWWKGCMPVWRSAYAALISVEHRLGVPVDLSFFAWMDSYLKRGQRPGAIDRCFPRPFCGLVFQPWMYRLRGRIPRCRRTPLDPHAPLHARFCRGVAVLDDKIRSAFAQRIGRPVLTFPDVPCIEVNTRSSLVGALSTRAAGRAVVLLTGVIDNRKGIGTFLRIAEDSDVDNWCFAIAGPILWPRLKPQESARLRHAIENPAGRVAVITSETLREPELNGLIHAADLLWLAYENFPFSSNLLSKAAAFQVPVLSNGEHLIGEQVRAYDLGFTVETDTESFDVFSIEGRARVAVFRHSVKFREGCARFSALHRREAIVPAFLGLVGAIGDLCIPKPKMAGSHL